MSDVRIVVWVPESLGSKRSGGLGVPRDLTDTLDEWASLLDPIHELRRTAPRVLDASPWEHLGRASISTPVLRLLREAAKDQDIITTIAHSTTFAALVEDGLLTGRSIQLLAGIATMASVLVCAGLTSKDLRHELQQYRDARDQGIAPDPNGPSASDPSAPAARLMGSGFHPPTLSAL